LKFQFHLRILPVLETLFTAVVNIGYAKTQPATKKEAPDAMPALFYLGWLMGLEPTTTGITILDSTN
jgi:hypothetical protein